MSSSGPILPLLRRYAPRLTRRFFSHHTCPNGARSKQVRTSIAAQASRYKSTRQTPYLNAFRSQSTVTSPSLPSTNLGKGVSSEVVESSFPQLSSRASGWWLIGSAVSVYAIVVLGGFTRLTESGLSITEWRPVAGTMPPIGQEKWEAEFAKYKASPEFKQINPHMDMPDFKKIFWMEWAHRLLGRAIGLGVLIPTIYFIARRKVSLPVARNILLINSLIGLQGFVGWWMVKSGLKDDLFAKGSHPRVSQYRLATHLGLAFTVYTSMLWNGLSILRERRLVLGATPEASSQLLGRLNSSILGPFRKSTATAGLLISTTVLSGALVAGLDAGLIYNEFPYMGLGLTPPKSELFSTFYSRKEAPHDDLYWRNAFENPSLVQLDHRILATSTFTAVNALWAYQRFTPAVRAALPLGARRAMLAALGLVWMQATLGITTLIYLIPTTLAAAHQAGSLALLTSFIFLGNRIWTPPRLAKLLNARLASLGPTKAAHVAVRSKGPIGSIRHSG